MICSVDCKSHNCAKNDYDGCHGNRYRHYSIYIFSLVVVAGSLPGHWIKQFERHWAC